MNELAGKVAVITGGSRGIGRAIAESFSREGAVSVICGRKQEALDQTAQELSGLAGQVVPIACHVGRPEDLSRLVNSVNNQFGHIDILVNNAGTNVAQGPCLTIDDSKFDKMIEVNLKSAFRLIQLVAPGMCERGTGSIINISSISGIRPQRDGLMYSTTKAALIMMTKCYALELGPSGVRVNAIAPGLVETVLSEYFWKAPGKKEACIASQPVKHLGQPQEIAEIALLLASDRSSYMTGEVVTVDGGALLS
jgi:dehydrogenase/reductase SDR family member 4